MSARRVAVLVAKELVHGSKGFVFILAVVIPVALSLLISLMVGTLFARQPRLGVVDLGASRLPDRLADLGYVTVRPYERMDDLRDDVERGAVDMGIALPPGFDAALAERTAAEMDLFVWGESLLKHRTLLAVTLLRQIIDLAGREVPVEVVTTLLGDAASVPWDVRLFPLVVIMTVILGGTMVPATSIVEEKQRRTLGALTVTPVSVGEVLVAKGTAGVLVSVVMGLVILALNGAFGAQPAVMALVLVLSAVLASTFGVILGALLRDINTLFAVLKGMGILLYAPALFYLFPEMPVAWVARLFPTYYVIGPIIDLSLHNAAWGDIAGDVAVLCGLIAVFVVVAALVARPRDAARLRLRAHRVPQ